MEIKLHDIPDSPGVYIFTGKNNQYLYIGKAKSLRNRLASYLSKVNLTLKTKLMLSNAKDIKFIITSNEVEAFLLEANLIKTEKPKYNVLLKDSKGYPYIQLTSEEYPRLTVTRNTSNTTSFYYGPFINAGDLRGIVNELLKIFPLRSCTNHTFNKNKLCIKYQIKRCLGPCEKLVTKKIYMELVNDIKFFFDGNSATIRNIFKERMALYAEKLMFEEAAEMKNRMKAMDSLFSDQTVVSLKNNKSADAFIYHQFYNKHGVTQLFVRAGMLIGTKTHIFDDEITNELMESYIMQFYHTTRQFPEQIICYHKTISLQDELLIISLNKISPHTISFKKRGISSFITLALETGKLHTELMMKKSAVYAQITKRLKTLIHNSNEIRRIECIDISHLSGSFTVGVTIVWENGNLNKNKYRKYRLRDIGNNDFKAIYTLFIRKIKGIIENKEGKADLYLIDGGIGQLNAALTAFKELSIDANIISISKGKSEKDIKHKDEFSIEKVHLIGRKNPIIMKKNDPLLHFLQRLRDEAHRFCLTYSRTLALKNIKSSPLKEIRGLGAKRLNLLLKQFPDIYTRTDITSEEITSTCKIPYEISKSVVLFLKENQQMQRQK